MRSPGGCKKGICENGLQKERRDNKIGAYGKVIIRRRPDRKYGISDWDILVPAVKD